MEVHSNYKQKGEVQYTGDSKHCKIQNLHEAKAVIDVRHREESKAILKKSGFF